MTRLFVVLIKIAGYAVGGILVFAIVALLDSNNHPRRRF